MRKCVLAVSLWMTVVLCVPPRVHSQEPAQSEPLTSSRHVPDSAWQRITRVPAFSYRNLREGFKKPPPPKPYKPSTIERIIYAIISFFSSTIGLVILWTVLISAVLCALWMAFFKGNRFYFARKKAPDADEDPSEEDLHGTAWLRLMEDAIATGDTRLAVRYGYLHVLQALADAGRIVYRPGKTNADYAAELAGGPIVLDFRTLSRTYEYTWYGSYPLTAPAFADYRERMAGVEKGTRA